MGLARSLFVPGRDEARAASLRAASPFVPTERANRRGDVRRGVPDDDTARDLGGVAGAALLADGYRGRASLVVDEHDVVLGATFVGQDVAELLHSATIAVTAGLKLDVQFAGLRGLSDREAVVEQERTRTTW